MAHFVAPFTAPWCIDLLNVNLNNEGLVEAPKTWWR
jgi:hypothetical protein